MNPIFYQYRNVSNKLDELIKIFESKEWIFSKVNSDYFHEYFWPDIVLSDKDIKLHLIEGIDNPSEDTPEGKFIIELLGSYNHHLGEKEGNVTLYIPKIKATAHQYFVDKYSGKTYDVEAEKNITELLSTVILIHEFVHWIIHWIESTGFTDVAKKYRFNSLKYSNRDEVYFHESLAQLFTKYICEDNSELTKIFEWLETKQPPQYLAYNDLILNRNLKNTIDLVLSTVKFMRQYDLQSFDVLKLLVVSDYHIANISFKNLLQANKEQINNKVFGEILERAKKDFPEMVKESNGAINGRKFGI